MPDFPNRFHISGLLTAAYNNFSKAGMGFFPQYANLLSAKDQGGQYFIGAVSSNNLPALRIHLELGAIIQNMDYVFIKHMV